MQDKAYMVKVNDKEAIYIVTNMGGKDAGRR